LLFATISTHSIYFSHSTEEHDINSTRSFGEGIEREVMCAILEVFRGDDAQWFNMRADGHCALSTSHTLSSARFVSMARKQNMAILGAAVALCLIRGMSTMPLDPIVIHFFIHDCDIHSIHPAILGEWHPRLRQTISDWLRLGPHGNPAPFQEHFATFHDLQVRRRAAEMF
jgi:hypothetical protein